MATAAKKKQKKVIKQRKPKELPLDGLSPKDLQRIRTALRQVWTWTHPWRLVKKRAMHADGFPRCENKRCEARGKPVPKVFVDHIRPVGRLDCNGVNPLFKMFIPSKQLQALCKKCHDSKTKQDRLTMTKAGSFTDNF